MKMNRILNSAVIFLSLLLMVSCDYNFIEVDIPKPPDPTDTISFASEVAPIFENSSCTGCHNGGLTFDLTAPNAYNTIINEGLVVPFNPGSSVIYTFPHPQTGTHNTKYSSGTDANLIYGWILQGALNN